MRFRSLLSLIFGGLCAAAAASDYQPPKPTAQVAILRETWHDAKRHRDVPVKIYYPEKGDAPEPVIIFSHGLGGSRETYEYLGRHWAGCGCISVHVQHAGSDDALWGQGADALRKSVLNPQNAINRLQDVSFAIDRILALNDDTAAVLHGRADPARIGIAGHSFGGWTTLAIAGENLPLVGATLADPRIKAGISMSPPVPKLPAERNTAFAGIKAPIFEMTGTLDNSPLGETSAGERRIAYDRITAPGSCLVIFNRADHMSFAINRNANDAHFHALISDASTAFWDAQLRGNEAARDWLLRGGFAKELGSDGTFESK